MFIVECGRGFSESLGRFDTFDCHDSHWTWLLALGVEYGWFPMGTAIHRQPEKSEEGGKKENYKPIDWVFAKRFFAEDAQNLAEALERALPDLRAGTIDLQASKPKFTLIMDEMSEKSFATINSAIRPEKMQEFIAFLQRGEFHFAYDD